MGELRRLHDQIVIGNWPTDNVSRLEELLPFKRSFMREQGFKLLHQAVAIRNTLWDC